MPTTAHYLYRAMNTQLDVWDQVIEITSPFVPTGVSPFPPRTTISTGLTGALLLAPVNKLLRAKELAPGQLRGHDFVSSSASPSQFFHKTSCEARCLLGHGDELDSGRADFQQYTVAWDEDARQFEWGAGNAMPAGLPEEISRGLLMTNMCEWGVFLLKPSVEKVVKLIDPQAEVHWLLIVPRRRLQFITPDSPGSTNPRHIATAHSVLLIRSPLAGNFVLDPTAEQYGHPREHRFLAWSDYKKHYVLRKSKWVGEAVWHTGHDWEWTLDIGSHPSQEYWRDARTAVSACLDSWLQNVQAGKGSLREGLDDEKRCRQEGLRLKLAVIRRMHRVQNQPVF